MPAKSSLPFGDCEIDVDVTWCIVRFDVTHPVPTTKGGPLGFFTSGTKREDLDVRQTDNLLVVRSR